MGFKVKVCVTIEVQVKSILAKFIRQDSICLARGGISRNPVKIRLRCSFSSKKYLSGSQGICSC